MECIECEEFITKIGSCMIETCDKVVDDIPSSSPVVGTSQSVVQLLHRIHDTARMLHSVSAWWIDSWEICRWLLEEEFLRIKEHYDAYRSEKLPAWLDWWNKRPFHLLLPAAALEEGMKFILALRAHKIMSGIQSSLIRIDIFARKTPKLAEYAEIIEWFGYEVHFVFIQTTSE